MAFEWRTHPPLQGRVHPLHPDDVQVLVHDGGPRLTDKRPELVWVRIVGMDNGVFRAEVLNQPHALQSVKQGAAIQFVIPATGEHLVMVREQYLAERDNWLIQPCNQCGFSELLDAPSTLIAKVFPSLGPGEAPAMFTSFCGVCGGVQVLVNTKAEIEEPEPQAPKKWWEFWK